MFFVPNSVLAIWANVALDGKANKKPTLTPAGDKINPSSLRSFSNTGSLSSKLLE